MFVLVRVGVVAVAVASPLSCRRTSHSVWRSQNFDSHAGGMRGLSTEFWIALRVHIRKPRTSISLPLETIHLFIGALLVVVVAVMG